jgi:Chaperone of endosialidase
MSTYSSLKFELILTGDQSGQWGNTTNTNIGTAVEQAIVGMATLSSGDFTANVATLTLSDTNAAQNARALCLNIAAGAVSAAGTINVPAIQKPYIVINNSSYTVTVKVSGLTGVAVPSGKRTVVYNNGTDVGSQVDYLTTLALNTLEVSSTATFSTYPVLSAETAGRVAIVANGKVLTTSPALTFDTPNGNLFGVGNNTPNDYWSNSNDVVVGSTSGYNGITILGGSTGAAILSFGYGTGTAVGNNSNRAKIWYEGLTDTLRLSNGGSTLSANQFVIDASGNVGISTTIPAYKLDVTGTANITGAVTLGSTLTVSSGATIQGLTVGLGPNASTGNTALGYQALNVNTGGYCTAVGYQALVSSQYDYHTAVGYQALYSQTGGSASGNTAVGYRAGYSSTNSTGCTYIGRASGFSQRGGSNTAVGYQTSGATYSLGTSYSATGNTYIGTQSGANNQTGGFNAGLGYLSLNTITVASGNTAIGYYALGGFNDTVNGNTTNTGVGYSAGSSLSSGVNNTLIGNNAQPSSTTVSNEITLGNSSIATLRCQVTSITALSDARDKYNVEDLPVGLDFINSLKARRFKWDRRDAYFDDVHTEDGPPTRVAVTKDGSRKSDDWNEGFIAQEVDEAAIAAGADWMKIVYKSNPERLEMAPGKLIPVLVKAIQELTARLEALEAKN